MESLLMKCHKKVEAELPLSLIESNILPRLPAKSVGRCMCVCKYWKSFLSTTVFARMHLRHVTINDYKLLLLDDQPLVTFSTLDASTTIRCNHPSPPDPSARFILATLDGLVCLASRERSTELAFWNPLTGAYRKVSSSLRFDFSMITSDGAIGFYIDSSNDYTLLCLIYGGRCGAFVYSNRLDSWRKLKFSFCHTSRPSWSLATFWGDCLYFVVTDSYIHIICFDVKKETFREIPSPLGRSEARNCRASLAVLNGSLHFCVSCDTLGIMWRMDDDDDEWVKVPHPTRHNYRRRHILCTTSSGDWLAVLEENKNSFEKMNTEGFIRRNSNFCSPSWKDISSRVMYVETLVSPNPGWLVNRSI